MKRIIATVVCLCLSITLFACRSGSQTQSTPQNSTEQEIQYANQEDFLMDMAAGITNRCEILNNTNEAGLNDAEFKEYREKLVNAELDRIEKYSDQTFEDSLFNELAHYYIDSCHMQFSAIDQTNKQDLFYGLWVGGSTARAGIITELYENYGLPLESSVAANYTSSTATGTYTISIEPDNSNSNDDVTFSPDQYDSLITIKPIEWTDRWSTRHCDLLITNNTDTELEGQIGIKYYDKKKQLIGVENQDFYALGKEQPKYLNVLKTEEYDSVELEIKNIGKANNSHSTEQYMTYTETKLANGKIYVEVTNNGTSPFRGTYATVVFYQGSKIVDVDYHYLGDNDSEIKPGKTEYEELSTKESFDRYELYVSGWMYN